MARVLVGLPFYNNESTLVNAVRSVIAQRFTDWELLMLDDGSTDGSLAIARAIDDSRVQVLSDGQQRGLPYRLNQIAAYAQSEYYARMDADDLMHPEKLAKQVECLDTHPQVDVVDTAICSINTDYLPVGVRGCVPLQQHPTAALRHALLHHATVMGRTQWFQRHPYDNAFPRAEDHELWCRTCSTSTFARIPEPLYFVLEDGSFTLDKYLRSVQTCRKIYRQHGPAITGKTATWRLLLESFAKDAIYRIATRFNAHRLLLNRRNKPLSDTEYANAQQIIQGIIDTPMGFKVQRSAVQPGTLNPEPGT